MKATFTGDRISFDLQELLESIPAEQQVELIETLACQDAVIKHVTDLILEGWTENACHGSTACTASATPYLALDEARRRVAKLSGNVVRDEIERLENALAYSEKRRQEAQVELDQKRRLL